MKIQSSYIFLGNPYGQKEKSDNLSVIIVKNRLPNYIYKAFPNVIKVADYNNFYKNKYTVDLQYNNAIFNVEFIATEVISTYYLDVVVTGRIKYQIVKCLEYIQNTLLNSGVRERYIDIISYDAVSEYYCNKIYPKLNLLERNLRKLLFNIYIVNFGKDYYRATIDTDLQVKIKKVINVDSKKEENNHIKSQYKATTKKETEEIERLQRFFYSFEYNDIQKLLFTPSWTNTDETEKSKFLKKHKDLSALSDEQLREAFSKYIPKSDWERFFSNKINISDIEDLIEQIRLFRNSVAHFKFFYKADYDKCNKLANSLNSAITKAIQITEEKDFAEKNSEKLSVALQGLVDIFAEYIKASNEKFHEIASYIITPITDSLVKNVKENNWLKALGTLSLNRFLAEEVGKSQEHLRLSNPLTSLIYNLIPSWFNETRNTTNSIKMDTNLTEFEINDVLNANTSSQNKDDEDFDNPNKDNDKNKNT